MFPRFALLAQPLPTILVFCLTAQQALAQGEQKEILRGHTARVTALAIDPKGHVLASASLDRTVRLWDLANCRELKTLRGHLGEVHCLAFAGSKLISGSADMTLRVWQVPGGASSGLHGHGASVIALAVAPDARSFMSSAADGVIKLWDAATGTEQGLVRSRAPEIASCVAFSADGKWLLWPEGSLVRVADAQSRLRHATLSGHLSAVSALVSPDGSSDLLSAGFDQAVRAWDPARGAAKELLFRGQTGVCALACRGDGTLLAAAELTGVVSLLELPGGKVQRRFSAPPGPAALVFSRSGRFLLSGHGDGTIRVWQLEASRRSPVRPGRTRPSVASPAPPEPAAPQDEQAVLALRRLGVDVHTDGQNALWVDFGGKRARDESLRYLEGLPYLEWLDLARTGVGDAGLVHLKGLRRLKKLDLSGTAASDASVEVLKQLVCLEMLNVSGTSITDAGLAQLRALPHLKDLVASAVRWRVQALPYRGRLMLDMDGLRLLLEDVPCDRRASLPQFQVAGPGRSSGRGRVADVQVEASYADGLARLTISAAGRRHVLELADRGTRLTIDGGRAFVLSEGKKTFALRAGGIRLEHD